MWKLVSKALMNLMTRFTLLTFKILTLWLSYVDVMLASCKLEVSPTMPSWGKLSTLHFSLILVDIVIFCLWIIVMWNKLRSCELMEFVYVLEKCLGHQSKPCIIHGGNLQHAYSGHSTMHLTIKSIPMVNKRDAEHAHILIWACFISSGKRYPVGGSWWYMYAYNDKNLLGT
jgi:hypothetical protein